MKNILFVLLVLLAAVACKSKKESTQTTEASVTGKHTGMVSHELKAGGCATIIKVDNMEGLILVPSAPLGKFDTDQLKISFNYQPLRAPSPKECGSGIMAEVFDISTK